MRLLAFSMTTQRAGSWLRYQGGLCLIPSQPFAETDAVVAAIAVPVWFSSLRQMITNQSLLGMDGHFRIRCIHILPGSGRIGAIHQMNSICTVLETASPAPCTPEF